MDDLYSKPGAPMHPSSVRATHLMDLVSRLQVRCYYDEKEEQWDPDNEVSGADLADFLGQLLEAHGLVPPEIAEEPNAAPVPRNYTVVGNRMSGSTWQMGYVETTYADMVAAFGTPVMRYEVGFTTDATWCILFTDGTIATIYNYKDGRNYLGHSGKQVEEITNWCVGGRLFAALKSVAAVLGLTAVTYEFSVPTYRKAPPCDF